ncbi:MAG TPA: hypothetical protein V6D15_11525 [Oculatellaceae cyanobacterium]|jgi:hypothetical protein
MSFLLEYITSNPQETKRLLGIDYKQLQWLIVEAEALFNQSYTDISTTRCAIRSK